MTGAEGPILADGAFRRLQEGSDSDEECAAFLLAACEA